MISQNGMDTFAKTFRRTLSLNADTIFNNAPPPGTYEFLCTMVSKLRTDPTQADSIAESLDTTESELFKNFDVSKFMDHFKLDPVAKSMLALSLRASSKSDLRTKGMCHHRARAAVPIRNALTCHPSRCYSYKQLQEPSHVHSQNSRRRL